MTPTRSIRRLAPRAALLASIGLAPLGFAVMAVAAPSATAEIPVARAPAGDLRGQDAMPRAFTISNVTIRPPQSLRKPSYTMQLTVRTRRKDISRIGIEVFLIDDQRIFLAQQGKEFDLTDGAIVGAELQPGWDLRLPTCPRALFPRQMVLLTWIDTRIRQEVHFVDTETAPNPEPGQCEDPASQRL